MKIEVSPNLCLTEFRRTDSAALVEYLNDLEIYRWTLRIPYPYTPAHAEEWLGIVEKSTQKARQPLQWVIRNEADKLIGSIGFVDFVVGQTHRSEFGYWLARPFGERGIMTAVVKATCRHAFENLGLSKITAHTFIGNQASARVLEKCGFELEGYLKQHWIKDGKTIDVRAYGLLRSPG